MTETSLSIPGSDYLDVCNICCCTFPALCTPRAVSASSTCACTAEQRRVWSKNLRKQQRANKNPTLEMFFASPANKKTRFTVSVVCAEYAGAQPKNSLLLSSSLQYD